MILQARRIRYVPGSCRMVILATCLFFCIGGAAQITLTGRSMPVRMVVDTLKKLGYEFYVDPGVLEEAMPVTFRLHNASIVQAMQVCCRRQHFDFEFDGSTVYMKRRVKATPARIAGAAADTGLVSIVNVSDQDSLPLAGATVRVKRTGRGVVTDADGSALIRGLGPGDTVLVSFIGYEPAEKSLARGEETGIVLRSSPGQLDETVVTGYGHTTARQNTGNITVVSADDIGSQPVSDPLAALEGRVPGLAVTQANGVPGAGFTVRVRGESSIANGKEPLYIVDGVPFGRNNASNSNILSGSAAGSLSPFYLIAPGDIGSIEVLKDADATAIYGSRGANGVILITTKKRRPGDSRWNVQVNSGISQVTRRLSLLDTRQYVQMRTEALDNDGLKPDSHNAPELSAWDTTRSRDWSKYLIGGTAYTTDLQTTLSGVSGNFQYLFGSSYHHESTVFPGQMSDDRATTHANWIYRSSDKRWYVQVNGLLGRDWNNQFTKDLSSFQLLDPHAPGPYDAMGNLVWSENGVSMTNPLAFTRNKYRAVSDNFLVNGLFSYQPFRRLTGLTFQLNPGYTIMQVNEKGVTPIEAQDPATNPTAGSYTAGTVTHTWIMDGRVEFRDTLGRGVLTLLAGTSWQREHNTVATLSATGFTSDALLPVTAAAPFLSVANQATDYHYEAFFGRVNYTFRDKYFFNLTGRRDGSSRFGPGKQFGNFGAAGLAWLFRNERAIREWLPSLSFGKLRGSYGVTGNDQIGDYHYLETWGTTTTRPYQGIPGFYPTGLANPRLAWETLHKLELAVELGFVHDRIFFTGAWYRHRSGNQLLPDLLPLQAGFTSVLLNFPAVVQNSGVELSLQLQPVVSQHLQWTMTLSGTFPQNRLLSFPNLANSSSANRLVVGQSLNILKGYRLTGVDPTKGTFRFQDVNKDGVIDQRDWVVVGSKDLRFYGGLHNSVHWYRWVLDVFLEERVQTGSDGQAALYGLNPPGMPGPGQFSNQTKSVLDRWRHSGDAARYQKFTTVYSSAAGQTIPYYTLSGALLANASFFRVKTISLSWQLPESWKGKLALSGGRFFAEAQNLFTISPYSGTDPETQNLLALPPLKSIVAGIQVNFK
ncbi:MAG TPA: SusC/RagA family TonB-linked outer membrane protein [Puia sp.]|nr:SusC/RagA family TonB-linked outer membrane protein [Puia sp.]